MEWKCYLLSLEAFSRQETGQALWEAAFEKVDQKRRQKTVRQKAKAAREASLGAGLLLQIAVREALSERVQSKKTQAQETQDLLEYDIPRALACVKEPLLLRMKYGERGKPYLEDYPFSFNLSHSGGYVCCGISSREIGVDIQRMDKMPRQRFMAIAERFFCRAEQEALAACLEEERARDLFYRLWTRKEAFGKLTGEGVAAAVGENLLERESQGLCWREWSRPQGYRLALCVKKNG